MSQKKILGIIPARFGSSRFPGKPLAPIHGRFMIQWVYEACSGIFDRLIVATDNQRIMDVVSGFKGEAFMTSPTHRSGTERCAEVLKKIISEENYTPDIVVNIQGDEPLVQKEQITALIERITEKESDIATLAKRIDNEFIADPNLVKVVIDKFNYALYFSRQAIPFYREPDYPNGKNYLQHIGLYAYKASVLKEIVMLPPSPLEIAESLEQLRWIEHGYKIAVQLTEHKNIGIDTPEDLKRLEKVLNNDKNLQKPAK